MTPKPRSPGGNNDPNGDGTPGNSGDGTSGDGKPSQSHGSIDASSSISNAQDATNDVADHGRPPGSGKPGDPTPTTPTTSGTQPSGQPDPNATPGGTPTNTEAGSPKQQEGHRIENDSATILARAGYKINQNTGEKGVNGTSDPDYNMEGKLWDCYAPNSDKRDNVRGELRDKVKKQSGSIVINMERSPMSVDEMKALLPHVKGLEEAKIIDKNGNIIDAFPQ